MPYGSIGCTYHQLMYSSLSCSNKQNKSLLLIIIEVIYIARYLTDKGEHTTLYKIKSTYKIYTYKLELKKKTKTKMKFRRSMSHACSHTHTHTDAHTQKKKVIIILY